RSRNFNLPDRDRLPDFHLDQENPIPLVGLHFGNARRNRTDDGNVSVCSCYDCTESGRVRRRHWRSFHQASRWRHAAGFLSEAETLTVMHRDTRVSARPWPPEGAPNPQFFENFYFFNFVP